jgi:hypothetical protein
MPNEPNRRDVLIGVASIVAAAAAVPVAAIEDEDILACYERIENEAWARQWSD